MSLKRAAAIVGSLLLTLGLAVSAQAATYSLVGGGAQFAIGGGLPLPIQATNPTATGTMFPNLLVPPVPGAIVNGTTAMTSLQKLSITQLALSKPVAPNKIGVFAQNPSLYAVATNLGYQWPAGATPVVFSTGARTGAKTTTFMGLGASQVRYSSTLASKFGGPGQFKVNTGTGFGPIPAAAVTIYAIAVPGPGNPPCAYPALTTTAGNAACVAALGVAVPNTLGQAGAPALAVATTPGGIGGMAPLPGVGVVNAKGTPVGTINAFVFTPNGTKAGFTNMATTQGFPWTVGKITISAASALGASEKFTITGMDSRTTMGGGTIQLVSGAVGQRTLSGPNANRGWLRLDLVGPTSIPGLSPVAMVALVSLLLISGGYMMRRRLFSAA